MTLSGCILAFATVRETKKGPTTPVFGVVEPSRVQVFAKREWRRRQWRRRQGWRV